MTIRKKTALALLCTLLFLFGAIILGARWLFLGDYERLQENQARQEVNSAAGFIARDLAGLAHTTADWAEWDDAFEYMGGRNPGFEASNLEPGSLANLNVEHILFLDEQLRVVKALTFDRSRGSAAAPVPPVMKDLLAHVPSLVGTLENPRGGVVVLDGKLALAAGHKIVRSSGTGMSRGTLILVRNIDFLNLSQTLGSPVRVRFGGLGQAVPNDCRVVQTGEIVTASRLLRGPTGRPVAWIEMTQPRLVYLQGVETFRGFLLVVLLVGLVFAGVAVWFLDRGVLSRLKRLGAEIGRIERNQDRSGRLSPAAHRFGPDELDQLVAASNAMLAVLEEAEQRASEQVRQSHNQLEAIFRQAPEGIAVLDPDTLEIYTANPTVLTWLGQSEDRLGSVRIEDLLEQDVTELQKELKEVTYKRGRFSIELRIPLGPVWRIVMMTAVPFQYRERPAILAFFRDVTERRSVVEALELVQRTLENSPVVLFRATAATGWPLEYVSRNVSQFSYSPEELLFLKRPLAEIVHPDDRGRLNEALDGMQGDASREQCLELRLLNRNGRVHWVDCRFSIDREQDHSLAAIQGVLLDISARVEAERQMAVAKQAAEAANVAKSQFLANISHEVRTPLNGVIGLLNLLIGTGLIEKQRVYAETALSSAGGLLQLINEILDFSKLEAGRVDIEPMLVELGPAVEGILRPQAAQAQGKGLSFAWTIAPEVPRVILADQLRLGQVLTNLAGNALKFTLEGGVELKVGISPCVGSRKCVGRSGGNRETPARSADLEVGAEADRSPTHRTRSGVQQALVFEVIDTGIGIPANRLDAIFEAFTQADGSTTRRFGGTGLGLAISRQLVERMGGEIGVTSREGEGSRFWFTLPLQPIPDGAESTPPAEPPVTAPLGDAAERRGATVLVAEDNQVNQFLVQELLVNAGYSVTIVDNGEAAVAAWEKEPFAAILMDCQMPVLDGMAASRAIRRREAERGTRVPIIALTAHAVGQVREECEAAGMDDYLSKPFEPQNLLATLARWINASVEQTGMAPVAAEAAPEPSAPKPSEQEPPGPEPEPAAETDLPRTFVRAEALHRCLGRTELLARCVRLFAEQLPQDLELIRKDREQSDWASLAKRAHRVKGAAGSISALDIRRAAEQLERKAAQGAAEEAGAALLVLEQATWDFTQECERLYGEPLVK